MKKVLLSLFFVLVFATVAWSAQTFNGSITGNAATVTTNANLTGDITSAGNATTVKESLEAKALNLSTGSEKVVNGTSDSNIDGWTPDATGTSTVTWDSGHMKMLDNAGGKCEVNMATPITTIVGHSYIVSVDFDTSSIYTGWDVGSTNGGGEYVEQDNSPMVIGTQTRIFRATGTSLYIRFRNSLDGGTVVTVDNVSVKELPLTVTGDIYLTGNARIVIPTFANNAAAIAGGLVAGQFYRVNAATDPEPLYIVH